MFKEEDEMTDVEIRLHYGNLISEAAVAFNIDASYAADIARKARIILARRQRNASS